MDSQVNSVSREFTIQRQGKTVVLFAGLLDLAHRQGLKAIRTRLVQVPSDDNGQVAICTAEVETERGLFSGIGDASPANVARPMLTCTIRMAETRAKARALRDAVNVAVISFEELDGDDVLQDAQVAQQVQPRSGAGDPLSRPAAPPPRSAASDPLSPRPAATVAASSPSGRGEPAPDLAQPTSRAAASVDRSTQSQITLIEKLSSEAGIPTEGLLKICQGLGFASPEAATKGQASKLIDLLKGRVASH